MRLLIIIVTVFTSCTVYGQQISGLVVDKQTQQPIDTALISTSKASIVTNLQGRFTIDLKNITDTIRISALGYSTYQLTQQSTTTFIIIELSKLAIELNEVKIFAERNRIKDSLDTRAMFAKTFNSSAPKFKDIVRISKSTGPIQVAGVTIIPLELIRAMVYKKSKVYKLQKTLLRDEDDKYVDSRFSKDLIAGITKLQTDSLSLFIEKYRPAIDVIKKMTTYDLIIYIKKSLVQFKDGS